METIDVRDTIYTNKISLIRLSKNEKWKIFLSECEEKWELLDKNFSLCHLPYTVELEDLIKKAKGKRKSRLFHLCCTEWGLEEFYKDIIKENINLYDMYEIAEEIKMTFNDARLKEYPKFPLKYPIRGKMGQSLTIEISEQQKATVEDISFKFGMPQSLIVWILHIYTFNAIFENQYFADRYEKYYLSSGYIYYVKKSIDDTIELLKDHLSFAEVYMEREIKFEKNAVENLFEPDGKLNAKIVTLNNLIEIKNHWNSK